MDGLPILNGAETSCDWGNDADAAVPGIFGPAHEPYLFRHDYVTNSNDSFWLANPHHPLTGYARIIGTEDTARTLRTRIGLIQVQARINGTDGQGPPGFTVAAMRRLDLSDDSYAAQLTLKGLVKLCDKFQSAGGVAPTSGGGTVKLGDACTTLAHWDGKANDPQRGAVLFATFWNFAQAATPSPFSHPFQLSHPVTTPYGLNTANSTVHTALGDAIQQLNKAHVPIDTTLGAVQYVTYHGSHIQIPGGPGDPDGIFNAIYVDSEPGDSLTSPDSGSSFIQVVSWAKNSRVPGRVDDPDLLRVVQPGVPALRGPDQAVQQEALAAEPVLPGPDRRRPAPPGGHRDKPGEVTSPHRQKAFPRHRSCRGKEPGSQFPLGRVRLADDVRCPVALPCSVTMRARGGDRLRSR